MGRKSTLLVGSTLNNWLVADKTNYPNTSNQRVTLRCVTCNSIKVTWTTNIKQDKVRCSTCHVPTRKSSILADLLSVGPVIAFHGSHMEIYLEGESLPDNAMLFEMTSERVLAPLTRSTVGIPEPDSGYVAHIKVPAKFVKYLLLDPDDDLTVSEQEEITAMWANQVYEPDKVFATLYQGSQTRWYEDNVEYAYLYWKDTKTWPLTHPPATPEPKPKPLPPSPPKPLAPKPEAPRHSTPVHAEDPEFDRILALKDRTVEEQEYMSSVAVKRRAIEVEARNAAMQAEWDAEEAASKQRKGH